MILPRAACIAALLAISLEGASTFTAQELQTQLNSIALDPQHGYEIRDFRIRRGDVSIYLNEGRLLFARPVAGHCIGAVFTTAGDETGDAEIIVMPPRSAERASLATHTGTPNLDEHFSTAVFVFSDATEQEVERYAAGFALQAPHLAEATLRVLNEALQRSVENVSMPVIESLLDAHAPSEGMLAAAILGRTLGPFEFFFQPTAFEPISIGSLKSGVFTLWAAYRPRGFPPYKPEQAMLEDYSLDVTIDDRLSMTATATFAYRPKPDSGRVVVLSLSPTLQVQDATLNGAPVEFLQARPELWRVGADPALLLISPSQLAANVPVKISIRYSGVVIRHAASGGFFVGERMLWYPYPSALLANFDLVFHCPERFTLVSTGELVDEHVADHVRTVHRRTSSPQQLAGFNLGLYQSVSENASGYHIECYADRVASKDMNGIPETTASVLGYYNRRWMGLDMHSLSVTPVPGYFGQGFPGLIYLSEIAYLREQDRPPALRDTRGTDFFSRILLPHEIAHQWWGNAVTAADYRSGWLMEAMANYAALEYISQTERASVASQILVRYRDDLVGQEKGKEVDSYGPVDFGARLFSDAGENIWHEIVYEKGSWVLHMLQQRLGEVRFRDLQRKLLTEYAGKPLTNEEFRSVASTFVPAGEPDRSLTRFFDTWVYGTGIPVLTLTHAGSELRLKVEGVDESFTADVPLRCAGDRTHWMMVDEGGNAAAFPGAGGCSLPRESDFLYRRN